ncbi:MAG: ribonuclease P protein component [Deltaproteobacteria bacterium]
MVDAKGLFRFTRKERISYPQDFKRVMKTGRKLVSRNFIVFMKENEKEFHRLGVVVSKEVGPATSRNRIKRVCREFFRFHKHRIKGTFDIIILAKRECRVRRYVDAKAELGRIFGV